MLRKTDEITPQKCRGWAIPFFVMFEDYTIWSQFKDFFQFMRNSVSFISAEWKTMGMSMGEGMKTHHHHPPLLHPLQDPPHSDPSHQLLFLWPPFSSRAQHSPSQITHKYKALTQALNPYPRCLPTPALSIFTSSKMAAQTHPFQT